MSEYRMILITYILMCFSKMFLSVYGGRRCVLCAAGVNLLVGTENGLMLLDRSGQGKVYNLINRRRFQQMDVLEGLNVLVTISGEKNKELLLFIYTYCFYIKHTQFTSAVCCFYTNY